MDNIRVNSKILFLLGGRSRPLHAGLLAVDHSLSIRSEDCQVFWLARLAPDVIEGRLGNLLSVGGGCNLVEVDINRGGLVDVLEGVLCNFLVAGRNIVDSERLAFLVSLSVTLRSSFAA